jgi:hypothetical protein
MKQFYLISFIIVLCIIIIFVLKSKIMDICEILNRYIINQIFYIEPLKTTIKGLEVKHHYNLKNNNSFWNNMNKLDDYNWYSGKMDYEFENMLTKEEDWRNNLIKNNGKKNNIFISNNETPVIKKNSNHKQPQYSNKKDYNMKTYNGINMGELFIKNRDEREGIYNSFMVKKIWKDIDINAMNDSKLFIDNEYKLESRTKPDHIEKNN